MQNISGTVDKAMDILDVFLQADNGLALRDLAEATGYNRTTVYRLVLTMVKRGLICQEGNKGKYFLGPKAINFGYVVRINLKYLDTMYFHLSRLCREQNVAVNTTLLNDNKALVIDEIGVSNDFRITALVGKYLPLYATAGGKVILAYMSDSERKLFFDQVPLVQITRNTLTAIPQLEKTLETVKKDGMAFDHEEHILGTWATAAPIFNTKNRVIISVSVVLPASRVDAFREQQLAAALKSCATEISLVMSRNNYI